MDWNERHNAWRDGKNQGTIVGNKEGFKRGLRFGFILGSSCVGVLTLFLSYMKWL